MLRKEYSQLVEQNYIRRTKVETRYSKRKKNREAKGIYGRKFPRQFESEEFKGWVYVIPHGMWELLEIYAEE